MRKEGRKGHERAFAALFCGEMHKDFAKESVFCGIHIARKGEMPGKKVYSESDLW